VGASAASLEVAIVRARYNPFGGAERFVQRALAALSANDLAVTVIARDWTRGDAEGLPVPMRFLKVDPFYVGGIWRDWSFARGVRRAVAGGRFDIVQSHERIPGMPLYRAGDGVHALALNPFHRYLLRTERAMFAHPALRAVICNSVMVRDEIVRYFGVDPARLHVIPNGIDLARFHPEVRQRHRAALRAQWGLDDNVPVFLMVGAGFERKGVAQAIAGLAAGPAAAHLVVVGHDKHQARYVALARRQGVAARVHFAGSQRDVLPWYGAADAFVLPTVYDPFPNAALEAWACGLPVITSTGCGAQEALAEGRNGWLVGVGDVAATARAMRTLVDALADPAQVARLRAAARAAAEPYSLNALGSALLGLYQSLLGGSPAPG